MNRLLLAVITLAPFCAVAEETLSEMYPGPWAYDFDNRITGALVQAKVKGCGIYRYRVSRNSNSEFLVYCSRDDEHWKAYMVWPNINKVMGPYQPDPSLP
jgi:hypothetical protein